MARIVIVSQSDDSRTKLYRLLISSGYQVFRSCSSGSELRRALSESEDCVVVMVGYTPDCKPDELVWDYRESVQILLIAKQPVLENIESPEIFKLTMPASGQAVIGAVEMLSQLHRMKLPRRTGESKDIVERAKAVLMKQKGISEPEAHRTMQQYAMNHGMKMAEFAQRILDSENK
ncbi:MAG: ANTAR domain-containing protein [Oscillospiraceae bacterium]|nr:ANTAR domain-containing protein [Oscillospiraceae bacterium]